MKDLLDRAVAFATMDRTVDGVRAALIFALTIIVTRLGSRWVRDVVSRRGDVQRSILAGRLAAWLLFALGLSAAFEELGFKLHVLLGAAGILSVAVGFAAQTTLSNLISGFFLFGERPFTVGDNIEVEGVAGEVLGVDMLATSLRTADGRFVRIPNEVLIKEKLTNQTRFGERRIELQVPLANDAGFEPVREKIAKALSSVPHCLETPAPSVFIGSFGETSVTLTVWAWAKTRDLQAARVALAEAIHLALADVKRSGLGR
ncbi:MAG TPA: mechanosensitive ion channel family protein [Polyangiaceae bacterium]|nr:mechanosensitive ion channel family protein [Polyangiaceae bacterium]